MAYQRIGPPNVICGHCRHYLKTLAERVRHNDKDTPSDW
ncbi:hypothetical protein T07_873 [Trichinella nelsoni]|uniref:Uncharacterized protein n=1 Tax=Trichinella nelsoni TaxID=6336 RepID=A0A0V0RAV2_9BILA|nr:hypothetical protein T07_873 [Trichinella nelsoni]